MRIGESTLEPLLVIAFGAAVAGVVALAGCQGADKPTDDAALAGVPESTNRWTLAAQTRKRDMPAVTARSAAQQVALMPPVRDTESRQQIDLLAGAYRLAVESDSGATDHFVLVAGEGVQMGSSNLDEHDVAMRVLARLGTMDANIAWAPRSVQNEVFARHRNDGRSSTRSQASFPGTRHAASIVVVTLDPGDDPTLVKGTITIESPDGRTARQGFESQRSGNGSSSVRLTGVRTTW